MKKKNKKSSKHTQPDLSVEDHDIQDATNVEPLKVSSHILKETTKESKRKESSDGRKPHELADLVRNGSYVSEAGSSSSVADHNSDTNRRKVSSVVKKKKSNNHSTLVLADEHHGFQDVMNVELLKMSSSPVEECRSQNKSNGLANLVGNGASVSEKNEKKKKSSNDTLQNLAVENHTLQDAMNVEPMKVSSYSPVKESNRRESSDSKNFMN